MKEKEFSFIRTAVSLKPIFAFRFRKDYPDTPKQAQSSHLYSSYEATCALK